MDCEWFPRHFNWVVEVKCYFYSNSIIQMLWLLPWKFSFVIARNISSVNPISLCVCVCVWIRSATWSGFACPANQRRKVQSRKKAHKPLRTSWFLEQMCRPCLVIIKSCYFFTWSRRTTRAKDHRLFSNLNYPQINEVRTHAEQGAVAWLSGANELRGRQLLSFTSEL